MVASLVNITGTTANISSIETSQKFMLSEIGSLYKKRLYLKGNKIYVNVITIFILLFLEKRKNFAQTLIRKSSYII